ncbi:MAG: hypothetical protein Q8P41_26215 [Pseudomonadota bacterium]|nr:hypothetical protein [Pseudomonadota bacterium]
MPRWVLALAVLAVAYLGYVQVRDYPRGGRSAAPLALGEEPLQEELDRRIPVTVHRGDRTFFVIKTHRYALTARVLAAHAYDWVWTSQFYDVDLGVAWGDQVARLTETYTFYQDARFLFWRADGPVADAERAYITTHVGNVHVLPAEGKEHVGRALRSAREGDLVALEGYLVVIQDAGTNELARSSTVRTDTGGGACEVMWVDRVQVNETVWE